MTMKLEIENVLGHGFFEADFEPGVTVVTGRNASGKTSLMLCLAALAAHNSNPAGISGTAKKNYVRDGARTGEARMDGRVWEPGKEVATPLDAEPLALPEAVGIYDFARTRPKAERSLPYAKLEDESKTPEAMLKGTWPHNAIKLEAVVSTIKRLGWDRAHDVFGEQLRDAKRRWSDVTGAGTYGVNKAAKWLPDGWSAEIVGMGEERARAVESDARDRLQGLETSAAVAADRRQRREEAAQKIPVCEAQIKSIDGELREIKKKQLSVKHEAATKVFKEAEEKWRELKNEKDGQPKSIGSCPDCGAVLTIGKGKKLVNMAKFEIPADIDKRLAQASEEYEAATKEFQKWNGLIRDSADRVESLMRSQNRASAELAQAKKDAELDNVEMVSPEAVDVAREDLKEASENVRIVTQMISAAKAAAAVAELAIVVGQLAPSGVRAGGMGGVVERVNNGLAKIKRITGWWPVKVEKDFSVTYNGRPPELIAASERAQINYSMQAAFALISKSRFVSFEGVDILHGAPLMGVWELCEAMKKSNPELHIVVDGTELVLNEYYESKLKHSVVRVN